MPRKKQSKAPGDSEMNKSPVELYDEREKRVRDAIELREPDRVPVVLGMAYFPARYAGVETAAAYYDAAAWTQASKRAICELEPDLYRASSGATCGKALGVLGAQSIRWPGGNLPPNATHQAVELECLKADEYDLFLALLLAEGIRLAPAALRASFAQDLAGRHRVHRLDSAVRNLRVSTALSGAGQGWPRRRAMATGDG